MSAAPVVILDELLGSVQAEQLLHHALAHEAGFRSARVALRHEGLVDESYRVSRVNRDLEDLMPAIEPAIRAAVDEAIPKLGLVNVDAYRLEPELAWSGDGGFFKRHTDTLNGRASHRVMTVVYYFHRRPKAFEGGRLRVHGLCSEPDDDEGQEIEPRFDRAVLFPSWYPHEVTPVRCRSGAFADGRFAITCWVHRGLA